MPTEREKLDFLNQFVQSRGYAHHYHRLMANHDLEVIQAVNPIPVTTYVDQRTLNPVTKELLLVASFTCLGSPPYIIGSHIRKAFSYGATKEEVLAVLAAVMFEAGRSVFETGLIAWKDAVAEMGVSQ
jgi:4-carboxymuconolactone decarboxylase